MNQLENKWESLWTRLKLKAEFSLRKRSLTWSIESAYIAIPKSKLQSEWENFFPKSYHRRQIPVWWDYFFSDSIAIRFEEAVSAHSFLSISRSWSCKPGLASLFFLIAQKSIIDEQQRWESILFEFSEYTRNPRTWNRYLRFPIYRKNLFPANELSFDWSIVWITEVPYSIAKDFPLSEAEPASFQKSDVKLAVVHCHINKVVYSLYEESFQVDAWLRDYFLEVQNQENIQESDRYYVYVGSDYSHIEIENLCSSLKLYRKKLSLDIKIDFKNPRLNLRFKNQNLEIGSWDVGDISLDSASRFSSLKKLLIPNKGSYEKINSLFFIPGGRYKLDPNTLDLIPINSRWLT